MGDIVGLLGCGGGGFGGAAFGHGGAGGEWGSCSGGGRGVDVTFGGRGRDGFCVRHFGGAWGDWARDSEGDLSGNLKECKDDVKE